MPGAARQFEPQITRTGGVPSKFRFTARCSECRTTDSYEASKSVPDELVARHFNNSGWVLGRDRSYDLCPACLRTSRTVPQSRGTRETKDRKPLTAASQSGRGIPSADQRPQRIDDILARHLGKPASLAEEVFRPQDGQRPHSSPPVSSSQSAPSPALSPEVEQALTGMAADLKSLRSAVELMAEQMNKLVALGGQQIEAVARLAPLLARSTDGLSSELREFVSAVRSISDPLAGTAEQKRDLQAMTVLETSTSQEAELSSIPEPVQAPQAEQLPEPDAPPIKARKAREKTSGPVVVKSIADAKRPNRFYTTVRLSRELWDKADFKPDDRVQIDWKGKTLSISRDPEGGVKPKSVGDATVVLQSWRLGDLNFDRVKVTSGTASLRLKVLS